MARTLDAVVAEMDGAGRRPGGDVRRHQPRLADGRRGNSGVILSQILRGSAPTLKGQAEVRPGPSPRRCRAAAGGIPGRAQADRGHDPDRRPRGAAAEAKAAAGGAAG